MPQLADLIAALPTGVVVTDPEQTEKYRWDWSRDAAAGVPLAVVRAESADHVQTAVKWAAAAGVPVTPRGAGTGLSGGASAIDGGLVVCLERMNQIEIDPAAQVAVVGPGALNKAVKDAALAHGLWYPPDPSSYEICSIGGNIATNAGGLCCVKYGVTTDYVLGLDVVLADGTLVRLGGKRIKDVAGLSLMKLFVGSEGTLGIVTRVLLRLVPAVGARSTLVATFGSVADAARAVVMMRQRSRPSMVELMDHATINAVEDYRSMGLDRSAGAMLVCQSDAPGAARSDEIVVIRGACEAAASLDVFVTDDVEEGEMFVAARRMAFDAIDVRGTVLHEDVGAPVPRLPELLAAVSRIAATYDLEIPTVAHAGDGNTHPLIVFDAADEDSVRRAHRAFAEIMQAAIDLEGTITGEHGVGRAKKSALPAQLGPEVMAVTRRIKAALDPQGIFNPGVLFDPEIDSIG
ncbi:MAG TPA: FAD-linked oxidase C-terminal domain-containing protein [Marmoricola sp.]|nr:FAD-linked oxidase C-terminal domain-containing protein [Marmoricola sp.]